MRHIKVNKHQFLRGTKRYQRCHFQEWQLAASHAIYFYARPGIGLYLLPLAHTAGSKLVHLESDPLIKCICAVVRNAGIALYTTLTYTGLFRLCQRYTTVGPMATYLTAKGFNHLKISHACNCGGMQLLPFACLQVKFLKRFI